MFFFIVAGGFLWRNEVVGGVEVERIDLITEFEGQAEEIECGNHCVRNQWIVG
jgi:hypothetical protein